MMNDGVAPSLARRGISPPFIGGASKSRVFAGFKAISRIGLLRRGERRASITVLQRAGRCDDAALLISGMAFRVPSQFMFYAKDWLF
jgi:hypothetical protein